MQSPHEKPPGGSGRGGPPPAARVLATALDGLVRSTRAGMPTTDAIGDRTFGLWQEHSDVELRLEPTVLFVDEQPVLRASPDEGRWLLPAFMAGLRGIRLTEDCGTGDLLRLATELSALESTLPAITRFRDWLWADGAEGFEVSLDNSFTDDAEAAFIDETAVRQRIAAIRLEAANALCVEAHRVATRELDAAAARDEFHTAFELFSDAVAGDLYRLAPARGEELRRRCEQSIAWEDGQVFLALAYPELQSALPPVTLARRLGALADRRADARFLGLILTLLKRGDVASRGLLHALQEAAVPTRVAARLDPSEGLLPSLAALLEHPDSPVVGDLVLGLLLRCREERAVAALLARLLTEAGAETVCRACRISELDPECAFVLVRLLLHVKAPERCLSDLLARVPREASLRLLVELPTRVLLQLPRRLEEALTLGRPESTSKAIQQLLGRQDRALVERIGQIFLECPERAWNRAAVTGLLSALAAHGLGGRFLVPMVRSRKEAPELRIMALDLLDGDPVAQAEAVRRSLKERFDDPAIRARVRDKRRRLREEDDE